MTERRTTNSLVLRLRENARLHLVEEGDYREAADEIERLRSEVSRLKQLHDDHCARGCAESDRASVETNEQP